VAESGAELLFVAMGVPRQEYFIEEHWEHLGARVVIGVGGSFDVIAGLRKRAPVLIQRAGLEWAYRLAQEPRRLFRRYLVTNSQFLGLMSWNAIARVVHSRRVIPRA
jgi:N-acetylglucosaminyldiphosphoundecaprenol N-acetyl-beta-D-mannosaminyltransferase